MKRRWWWGCVVSLWLVVFGITNLVLSMKYEKVGASVFWTAITVVYVELLLADIYVSYIERKQHD